VVCVTTDKCYETREWLHAYRESDPLGGHDPYSASKAAVLSLTTVSVISVLLFSFAPVTLFFLVSIRSYHFFLLLNVAIFGLTGFIGVRLFYSGIRSVMDFTEDTPMIRNRLLLFWLVLYGLVGSQLGWTLRPFFGSPGQPFELFREVEGNFYSQVITSFFSLLFGR